MVTLMTFSTLLISPLGRLVIGSGVHPVSAGTNTWTSVGRALTMDGSVLTTEVSTSTSLENYEQDQFSADDEKADRGLWTDEDV